MVMAWAICCCRAASRSTMRPTARISLAMPSSWCCSSADDLVAGDSDRLLGAVCRSELIGDLALRTELGEVNETFQFVTIYRVASLLYCQVKAPRMLMTHKARDRQIRLATADPRGGKTSCAAALRY